MPEGKPVRSAEIMAISLKDPSQAEAVKNDPERAAGMAADAIRKADEVNRGARFAMALEADRVVYRMTTMFLGSAIVLIATGIVAMKLVGLLLKQPPEDVTVPESLVAIASAAVGALAGLLSPLATRN